MHTHPHRATQRTSNTPRSAGVPLVLVVRIPAPAAEAALDELDRWYGNTVGTNIDIHTERMVCHTMVHVPDWYQIGTIGTRVRTHTCMKTCMYVPFWYHGIRVLSTRVRTRVPMVLEYHGTYTCTTGT